MNLNRIRAVRDLCPLPTGPNRAVYTTHWRAASVPADEQARLFLGGYTTTVVRSRLFTWHRTFTQGTTPPTPEPFKSLLHLHEWIPCARPAHTNGWWHVDVPHRDAIVFFTQAPHTAAWSSHARRHLAAFKKCTDVTLELGTRDDFAKNIAHSQVPHFFHRVFIALLDRHLAAHPATIEILVARMNGGAHDGTVAACFVSGVCAEILHSYYITGFFNPLLARTHAMTGLIDWWMMRARAQGLRAANFGDICGPRPLPIDANIGYSNFKTYFGAHRVWFPRGYWKWEWRFSAGPVDRRHAA